MASGGITPQTAPAIAATGVDLLSIGWITHSAPNFEGARYHRATGQAKRSRHPGGRFQPSGALH